MQHDIPDRHQGRPNPFLTHWQLSGDCANVLREAGGIIRDVYRATVAKQSGALAESARVSEPYIAGKRYDRLQIDVIAGEGTPRGGYGASHEFGIGIHPKSRVPPTVWMPQDPVDDFVKVLAIVDSLQ